MSYDRTTSLAGGLLIFTVAGFLTACAPNAPLAIALDNAEEIKTRPTESLCVAYYVTGSDQVRDELNRRAAISPQEWPFIEKGRVTEGMSPCAVEAAWGDATLHNHTATPTGQSIDAYLYKSGHYATFQDGRVLSFIGPP